MEQKEVCIFWFRRDLRLDDNVGLYQALKSGYQVLPVFIFDTDILKMFESPQNAQVEFILQSVNTLNDELKKLGSSLIVKQTTPTAFFDEITTRYIVKAVYANEDYELSACTRDTNIHQLLLSKGIRFNLYKDHVIFAKDDVLKDDKTPYTIFTPYSRKWIKQLEDADLKSYDSESLYSRFLQLPEGNIPTLGELGYLSRGIAFPEKGINDALIRNYHLHRDYPAVNGTSHLGVHLRFGTISIRKLVSRAKQLNEKFLNELIWREFYHSIAWHYPRIGEGASFKPRYDEMVWRNNEADFSAWCEGATGYPIVDAGMRQLNTTGYMHNRVRMIAASFLIKHLLIDWRWGEAYFANKLLDFDFAANNGGWQWAASSGCDAVPYFRIFNPKLQADKFDKESEYILKWVPEARSKQYTKPIVEHEFARNRALEVYRAVLGNQAL